MPRQNLPETGTGKRNEYENSLALRMKRLTKLLAVISQQPDNWQACLEAGRICRHLGEFRRAATLFQIAANRYPDNPVALRLLAETLAVCGKKDKARRLCLEYLQASACPGESAGIIKLLINLENQHDLYRQADIDFSGFLIKPEDTFLQIVSKALLPYKKPEEQLHSLQRSLQRYGCYSGLLAEIFNTGEFKKQAVSWFVCGSAPDFISGNGKLWSGPALPIPQTASRPGCIVTSFFHPDPTNKVRNGLVAKYLQHKYGCPIISLGDEEHYRRLHRQLAASFAIGYHHLELKHFHYQVPDRLKQARGSDLRRQILQATIDGLPVGDLIYDHYLRRQAKPTIETFDPELDRYFQNAAALVAAFRKFFRQHSVSFVVLDHLVYLRWGILARTALSHGATLISHHGRSSPIIARIQRPGQDIPAYEASYLPQDFNRLFKTHGHEMAALGLAIVRRYYQQRKPHKHTIVDGVKNKLYKRRQLLERLGMDPRKPVVFIMAHTMTDAPHLLGRLLFDDYFQWLKATLEMAARIPGVNWIVKEHPFAEVYTGTRAALEMAAPYADTTAHVRCCPLDFHPGGLLECADALVTARGTAGLEAAVFGKPCLLAGQSAYSGHGFTIEPDTVEAYRQALENLTHVGALSPEATMRARAYAYLFFEASRISCSLLPHQPLVSLDPLPDDIQWHQMANLLKSFSPRQDPFFINLMHTLESDIPYLLDLSSICKNTENKSPKMKEKTKCPD